MSNLTTIAAGRNDALLSFADSIVDFTNAGGTIAELRSTIESAVAPKPAPARKARKVRTRKTADGRTMVATAGSITDGQFTRIGGLMDGFTDTPGELFTMWVEQASTVDAPKAKSVKGMSMADASDFTAWLKA